MTRRFVLCYSDFETGDIELSPECYDGLMDQADIEQRKRRIEERDGIEYTIYEVVEYVPPTKKVNAEALTNSIVNFVRDIVTEANTECVRSTLPGGNNE